jgi:Kef-type K+ transport system membrane component KefB
MSSFEISVLFFLQLAVILGVCRAVGWVAKYFGQPQVVAEMIAGVLMGPSLFGYLTPELQAWLFPAESKTGIYIVSQVGLVLYMFLIGLEFDTGLIANRLRSAIAVSVAGIAAPFALGAILSYSLTADATFFTAGVSPIEAMLFTGASMSITAFPMLARIIYTLKSI